MKERGRKGRRKRRNEKSKREEERMTQRGDEALDGQKKI